MRRPAEVAGGVGSVGLIVGRLLGVEDPDVLVALGAALGLVPAAVTVLVTHGGIRGVLLRLWRGDRPGQ